MARRMVETQDYLSMLHRLIRAAGKRVAKCDPDELAYLIELRAELDEAIVVGVRGLRQAGITWESIGQATGTTRQGAIMKWAAKCSG